MAKSQKQAKGAGAYGREALAEWSEAIRYGRRAIGAKLRDGVGDAADAALARFGTPGKLAAKASLGSRVVDRIGGDAAGGDESSNGNGAAPNGAAPFPIQESIDVAVPLGGVFELCSQFLDFPQYLERVTEVEEVDDSHFVFVTKAKRRLHEVEVEVVDERANERIEWECDGELGHEGLLTFHPLAPRLTRLELTIERRPEGVSERLARQLHLPERAIQAELHRFKAHAELLDEDFEDYAPEERVEEDELEPA